MKQVLLFAFALALGAGTLTYKDPASHVVVHYPKGWRLDRSASAFAIVNFPDRDRPPQMLVPPGKAMIIFEAPAAATSDEYIQKNRLTSQEGFEAKSAEIETNAGKLPARQLRQDHDKFLLDGRTLMNIFSVRGKLYEAQLIFRGTDRKAEYESVYYALLKSLEFPKK